MAAVTAVICFQWEKKALNDLDKHLKTQDMTLSEAINELQTKFDSPEITTVCLILKQGMETGRMTECASDLARQCSSSKQQIFEKKKARLERALTYVMLVIFGSGMGYLLYRFITSFTNSLSGM